MVQKAAALSCNRLLQLLAFIFLFFLLITTTGKPIPKLKFLCFSTLNFKNKLEEAFEIQINPCIFLSLFPFDGLGIDFLWLHGVLGSSAGRRLQEKTSRAKEDSLVENHGGALENGNDLVTMDYTPARKNRPIHN